MTFLHLLDYFSNADKVNLFLVYASTCPGFCEILCMFRDFTEGKRWFDENALPIKVILSIFTRLFY